MALVFTDPELRRRLETIQKAMALIFAFTIDHTSRSDAEATMQLLGIRLFNAAASGIKLGLSGYYQTAFHQARDIMETGTCSIFSARRRTSASSGASPTGRNAKSSFPR
jgi:hypothetical protein